MTDSERHLYLLDLTESERVTVSLYLGPPIASAVSPPVPSAVSRTPSGADVRERELSPPGARVLVVPRGPGSGLSRLRTAMTLGASALAIAGAIVGSLQAGAA